MPTETSKSKEMGWGPIEQVNRGWRFSVDDGPNRPRRFVIQLIAREDAAERYASMIPLAYELWKNNKRSEIAFHLARWCNRGKGENLEEEKPKAAHEAAVELGKLGGAKGGKARAERMSPEERSEAARRAAEARWASKADAPFDDAPREIDVPVTRKTDAQMQEEREAAAKPPVAVFTERELLEAILAHAINLGDFAGANEDRLKRLEKNVARLLQEHGVEYDRTL